MKEMLKLGFVLAAFAAVACVALAFVNTATAPAINKVQQDKLNKGLKTVFNDADSFEQAQNFEKDTSTVVTIEKLYIAKKAGVTKGAVVQATGPTYDKATVLIGLTLDRKITGMQILSLTDTPGFGQKALEPSFYTQFAGKSADSKFALGDDMDAISGATITSKGFAAIMRQASYVGCEYLSKNEGGVSGGEAPVLEAPAKPFTFEEAIQDILVENDLEKAEITSMNDFNSSSSTQNLKIDRIVRNMKVTGQYLIRKDDEVKGAICTIQGIAYHGPAIVLTAVDTNNSILGVRILSLEDTPNIGLLALEKDYYKQFTGKNVNSSLLVSDGGVDAISGATITSACIADIVKVGAVEAYNVLTTRTLKPSITEDYTLNELYAEE